MRLTFFSFMLFWLPALFLTIPLNMKSSLEAGPSLHFTRLEQGNAAPSLESLEGTDSTRREFLTWLGRMAAATAIVGALPLAGCESPNDTHRRVCREGPHVCKESEALIELNNRSREREDSHDSHGTLRCWEGLLHPKKWLGNHWDNLAMTTAAGFGPQMFPGDSDFENGLARFLAGTMTFFNAFTRGIAAPETVYAFFLTLWGKWSGIFNTIRGAGDGGADEGV